jgi:hypothetical protein
MGSNADHYNCSLTANRERREEDQQITSYSFLKIHDEN